MPNVNILNEETSDVPEPEDFSFAEQNGNDMPGPDFSYLFDAPNLASFVRAPRTATQRQYEAKVASLLKAGMVGSINSRNLADAATFIYYGHGVSSAAGALADADTRAKAAIDFLTAPANPYAMFALTALPMIAQLWRNHEKALADVPGRMASRKERRAQRQAERENAPQMRISLPFGKSVTFRARLKFGKLVTVFRTQTASPEDMTVKVFSDAKVVDYLQKQGIVFRNAAE